jgi:hypothetical protein
MFLTLPVAIAVAVLNQIIRTVKPVSVRIA